MVRCSQALCLLFAVLMVIGCSDDDGGDGAGGTDTGTGGTDTGGVGDAATGDMGDDASLCAAPTEGQNEGIEVSGQTRSYFLALPDDDGPRPLMVVFHGTDGTGAGAYAAYGMSDFIDAGFIVLSLDGNQNGEIWPVWDSLRSVGNENAANPDVDFFDEAVACLSSHYEVDADLIFISGQSAGGIMVNHVLNRRSDMLAGGIVASGVFDLTQPDPPAELDGLAVIVTWGGNNDAYSGSANGDVEVPEINFVEQAAVASSYYEAQESVEQVFCRGSDLGHVYLDEANGFFIEYLLANADGVVADGYTFANPGVTGVTCSANAATYVSPVVVECSESSTADCQAYCGFVGDCVVENGTVASVLGPQMTALGFTGDDFSVCGGCLTNCEADVAAGGTPDVDAVGCFADASETAVCGPGIPGAFPLIDAVNLCCEDATDSEVCTRLCETLLDNDVAVGFFGSCQAWSE